MSDLKDEEDFESSVWVFSFSFISYTARLFCFTMCLVILLLTGAKKESNLQFNKQIISQFNLFLVYQAKNFLLLSPYVSTVITIKLFLSKHCYGISELRSKDYIQHKHSYVISKLCSKDYLKRKHCYFISKLRFKVCNWHKHLLCYFRT